MSERKKDQLIRLVRRSSLDLDTAAFLLDRVARGLSPRTISYYSDELRHLAEFLGRARATEVRALTPPHLRDFFLHLSSTRSPGGVHAAYRAIKVFLRWWEAETEPDR